MKKPKLLDLFSGAGGAARGYQLAGFYVVGVDVKPQPRYIGDEFHQADALEFLAEHGRGYDLIHASPPCQVYSVTASLSNGNHPALIEPVRELLQASGRPYVIENVPGAPLENPLMLCGSMFGLGVIRHRLFECCPPVWFPPGPCQCKHGGATGNRMRRAGVTRTPSVVKDNLRFVTVAGNNYLVDEGRAAMGIDWMTRSELSQAIPPVYTEWLGKQMLRVME